MIFSRVVQFQKVQRNGGLFHTAYFSYFLWEDIQGNFPGANVFCDLYAMVGVVRSLDMLILLTVSREKTDLTDYDRA